MSEPGSISLYTLDNAYRGREEADKGSIEVGKLGDLDVLGANPTAVEPQAIADIPVQMTILGGVPVYTRAGSG